MGVSKQCSQRACRVTYIFPGELFAKFRISSYFCSIKLWVMSKAGVKRVLINHLKKANAFWSYQVDAIKDVPDDILVELVMLHLDLDDINKLFEIYPYSFVKKAWIKNVVAQGEMYYVLNKFFAWYYFKMKKPGAYVRSMATRELNKKLTKGRV